MKKIKERGYKVNSYQAHFDANWKRKSTAEIIAGLAPEKVAIFIPFQNQKDVELDALRSFLLANANNSFRDPYRSYFKKLACFYDCIKFGFPA